MAAASKAKKSKRSSEKHQSVAKEERGSESEASMETKQKPAASKGLEDDEEGPSQFQEELERLRKEVGDLALVSPLFCLAILPLSSPFPCPNRAPLPPPAGPFSSLPQQHHCHCR